MAGAGLILAAPASGSGKTLVTAGLLRCLRNRGWRVAAAKVGPDYIDPTFHSMACGSPCLNLDSWAMRQSTLAEIGHDLEADADLVLCEGVMGLFDGAGADGTAGSTAELARITGWPVILVIDARGQSASIAALASGFAHHDPSVPIAGIILNRVAGARHLHLLEAALTRHLPAIPVLGAILASEALMLPSRHLGLVPAPETTTTEETIERGARAIAQSIDLEALVALARSANLASNSCQGGLAPLGRRIAVAKDDAFVFAYPSLLQRWRSDGVTLSFFSPLADDPLDPTADAIYLPGGYPELHAEILSSADRFMSQLRRAAAAGITIYGECGGFMVLGEVLADAGGKAHRMAGLLPVSTSFAERRRHLGYRKVELLADHPFGPKGTRFRGHEFHYATILSASEVGPLFKLGDAEGRNLGLVGLSRGSVSGSFVHLIDRET